jgi:hypothetical protein
LVALLLPVSHFIYHLTRLGALSAANDVANQLSLAYGVVLSLALLVLVKRVDWSGPARGNQSGLP